MGCYYQKISLKTSYNEFISEFIDTFSKLLLFFIGYVLHLAFVLHKPIG